MSLIVKKYQLALPKGIAHASGTKLPGEGGTSSYLPIVLPIYTTSVFISFIT
jgi:hypothetical protein